MKIQKNSRQVPKDKAITSQRNYSDMIYCYLQVNSTYDEETGIRMIEKSKCKKTTIAAAFNITRQTVATKLNKLKELDLIEETNKGIVLKEIAANKAFLIPFATMRKLTSAFNENAVTIYVYLFNRYIANKEIGYDFTATALKDICGLGTNTHCNNYIIDDILELLASCGLIQYEKTIKGYNGKV